MNDGEDYFWRGRQRYWDWWNKWGKQNIGGFQNDFYSWLKGTGKRQVYETGRWSLSKVLRWEGNLEKVLKEKRYRLANNRKELAMTQSYRDA
jgi:hypothetical protein